MGNGIAHIFAQNGYKVTLIDRSDPALVRAMQTIEKNLDRQVVKGTLSAEVKAQTLAGITTCGTISQGVQEADLVVEAATENIEIKLGIFRELDGACKPGAILASNTSSISITKIASVTKRPGQVIGMHFMNPVPVMKLVEVIRGFATNDETAAVIMAATVSLANRILMPMINEAITTLFEGVAGVEEIDTVMKLGMAHPMGPLQLADFIGLDVCLSILDVMYKGFGRPHYYPCPLLVNMVNAGNLGVKSGQGFYTYTPGSKDLVVAPAFRKK